MNSTIFFVVVIFIGFLLFNFYQNKKRNDILNSLIGYLNAQDYDGFYKASEDIQVKRFIPDYNINYLRLSAALMQNDKNKIEKRKTQMLFLRLKLIRLRSNTIKR